MIIGRRRQPPSCLILFPLLTSQVTAPSCNLYKTGRSCTGYREVALPGALCVTQCVCINVLYMCRKSVHWCFILVCFNACTHAYVTVYSLRSKNSVLCACSHLCVGVYTERSTSPDHLISLHLIMGLFYLGFQLLCFSGKWVYAWQDLPEAL